MLYPQNIEVKLGFDKIKELNNNTIKDDKTPPEDSKTIYDIPIIGKVDIKKVFEKLNSKY